MARETDAECRIRVGRTLVAIQAPDAGLARRLRSHFRVSAAEGKPDIRVKVSLTSDHAGPIVDSLFEHKSISGDSFEIGGGIVRGTHRDGSGEVDVTVDRRLLAGRLIRVFEQLLYQAFFSDPQNKHGAALLLHSSGVIHHGVGYLFTGSSGAGKSTVARLSARDTVLNDEICLVRRDGDAWVEGTPFNGFFRHKHEGSAPLRCIFALSQAAMHAIAPMGHSEAVAFLLPQIVPPIGLNECVTRDTLECMLDMAGALERTVPVRRLEFRPDAGFWKNIDELGSAPGGGRI